MPSREGRRPRRAEEEFVLFLQGIPSHCRWQELKDFIRQTALHIRQAVVYDDQHGFPTGVGQIIVKIEDEAWRTYQRLSTSGWEGQSLVVTLARTSSPTNPIAGPTKSPICGFHPGYVPGYSTPPRATQNLAVGSSLSPESPPFHSAAEYTHPHPHPHSQHHSQPQNYNYTYNHSHIMNAMAPPFLPMYHPMPYPDIPSPLGSMPTSPSIQTSFCESIPMPMPVSVSPFGGGIFPTYPFPTMGFRKPYTRVSNRRSQQRKSVSTCPQSQPQTQSHNQPETEAEPPGPKSLYIQNLPLSTTTQTLKSHLSTAGPLSSCTLTLTPSTDADADADGTTGGKCKGFARAVYIHADDARRAERMFHDAMFCGVRIKVRVAVDDRGQSESQRQTRSVSKEGGNAATTTGESTTNGISCLGGGERDGMGYKCPQQQQQQQSPLVVNGSGIAASA